MANNSQNDLFPLIRHVSQPVTAILLKLPISANFVTTISLFLGLSASALLATTFIFDQPFRFNGIGASLLLVFCYVLDNCDGDIAREKKQCSAFGRIYDSCVDWVVHAVFFASLGLETMAKTGEIFWCILGFSACAGATVNYFIGFIFDVVDTETVALREKGNYEPKGVWERILFIFRELTRADFCFIVLALSVFDLLWALLPLGAVGAQIYWGSQFLKAARRFHV